MITRKIGKLLRGKASGFQIVAATVLGGLLATVPGFAHAPLLMLLLFCAFVILNANLFLAGIAFLLVKLFYYLLLPVFFHVGIFLLDGPLAGPVALLVNAPVTAWFGLEYYVTLPALMFGSVVGLLLGMGLHRSLRTFRRKMATLEAGSPAYEKYTGKRWVRILAWLVFGGLRGKQSWQELSQAKGVGMPVRPIGIVFVVSIVVLAAILFKLLDERIVTHYVRDAMERINGATVDLAALRMDLRQNRIELEGLAMADPENLSMNRFSAGTIRIDVSGMSLLAKKAVLDNVTVLDAAMGTERRLPGRLTVPRPPRERERAQDGTLEGYLRDAVVWRERLQTIKRLYDKVAPHLATEDAEAGEEPVAERLSVRQRLAQRAAESGYARVASDNLIRQSPRLLVRELEANNIRIGGSDERFHLQAQNLATQPVLVPERGRIHLVRADQRMQITLNLPAQDAPSVSELKLEYLQMPMERVAAQTSGQFPLQGGSMDLRGAGRIENAVLDVPITVTVRQDRKSVV